MQVEKLVVKLKTC